MSTYNPEIKIFYGPMDSEHRIIPAPDITIGLTYNYSNDTIIGYTYNITLTGFITSLDLRDLEDGDEIPNDSSSGIGAVTDHISKLRNILTQNGSILYIVRSSDSSILLKAKGGILRSFNIDQSSNNAVYNVPYTATLEFQDIDIGSEATNCSSVQIDSSSYTPGSAGIVDISKYKIKTFQDSWNFTFDENEAFNKIRTIDSGNDLNINNHTFSIQYSISATGKHYFEYNNESTGSSKLLPAWEQAKNFVQHRLYEQVTHLIGGILKNTYNNACSSSDNLTNTGVPSSGNGLLNNVTDNYNIFNELISCEASESEGSFSATYNATVKTNFGGEFSTVHTKHTVSKNINKTTSSNNTMTSITVNGTIEGLIPGGLINGNGPLVLPANGSFLISNNPTQNKYNNAKTLLDILFDPLDYASGLGNSGKRDLKPSFKNALGITMLALEASAPSDDPIPDPPHPTSFNLTHDYNNGTINYSVEYNSRVGCGRKYKEFTIQTNNPTKVTATFNIPNSFKCPTIQELGTYTAKTMTINIAGIDFSDTGQPALIDLGHELDNANPGCLGTPYFPTDLPFTASDYILTQQQYTKNPIDGSYSINLGYICNSGCSILG